MENNDPQTLLSNPQPQIYNTQAHIQRLRRSRFLTQMVALSSAVIILAVTLIPLLTSSMFFPQNGLSLFTGFGAGMIVVIIPLIITEINK